MRRFLALLGTILAVASAAPADPQAPAPATPAPAVTTKVDPPKVSADEAAIRAADEAFVKAFNAGDVTALTALFDHDAEVIDAEGNTTEGREAIAAQFADAFESSPGTTLSITTDSTKFITPDVARVRGRAVLKPGEGGPAEPSRFTVIYVKRDGKWLQASVRDEEDHPASHEDHLKALEWFVGEWVSESEDAVVQTNCEWAENKNFLIRTFTVRVAGKPALTGHQRIGWDPLTNQFKSWVFDSDGGYGEGYWSNDGDRWVIKATGVRRDGRHASATQVITRVNKDMILWKSVDRDSAGKASPDVDEFALVRKPPKPR